MAKDGGPAFPAGFYPVTDGKPIPSIHPFQGMSLRDWFAGCVLNGIYSDSIHWFASKEDVPGKLSKIAYGLADAMIEEREKEKPLAKEG